MLNGLLNLQNPSSEGIRLCIYYGVCGILIVVGLLVIAARKRKLKKQLRAETVEKYCLKAKAYAKKTLAQSEMKGFQAVLGSTKLHTLSKHLSEAAWYAFQIAETKGDIFFSGIANDLDALSSALEKEAEMGIVSAQEVDKQAKKTVEALDAAIEKLNAFIEEKGRGK